MKISIVGGGWLGLPLAKHLSQSGHLVVATKRSADGISQLNGQGIEGIRYTLGDALDTPELVPLFDADIMIINIPPGRKTLDPEQFVGNMTALIKYAKQTNVSKLLFVKVERVEGTQDRDAELGEDRGQLQQGPTQATRQGYIYFF